MPRAIDAGSFPHLTSVLVKIRPARPASSAAVVTLATLIGAEIPLPDCGKVRICEVLCGRDTLAG